MAAAQEEVLKKWEGKATAKLKGVRAEQVWALFLDDFCSFHKWLPTIDTCRRVEGVNGKPGLVRYCASAAPPPPTLPDQSTEAAEEEEEDRRLWCHERLIAVDPRGRSLSYEVLENNLGIKSYVSTIKVSPLPTIRGTDGEDGFGCQIQWSFSADPIEGMMTCDAFSSYVNFALQGMAENMERALQSNNNFS